MSPEICNDCENPVQPPAAWECECHQVKRGAQNLGLQPKLTNGVASPPLAATKGVAFEESCLCHCDMATKARNEQQLQ